MKEAAFKKFLAAKFDNRRHADAIFARCTRIERELQVDLDGISNLIAFVDKLESIATSKAVHADLRSAIYRYSEFKETNYDLSGSSEK